MGAWAMATSRPRQDELFAGLRAYSEVKSTGLNHIKSLTGLSGSDSEKIYLWFQSFIRQAETFFEPTKNLHHRASPLLTYYGLLNLAKAILCIKNPQLLLQGVRLSHGLCEVHKGQDFEEEAVKVQPNTLARTGNRPQPPKEGVFSHLYQAVVGQQMPPGETFHIQEMLKYITELGADYVNPDAENLNRSIGRSVIVADPDRNNCWHIWAVHRFVGLDSSPDAFKKFTDVFEEVSLDDFRAERYFDIVGLSRTTHRFFQTRTQFQPGTISASDPYRIGLEEVKSAYCDMFLSSQESFLVLKPQGSQHQYAWRELIAGYIVFFYLGSLVRYHPYYLERLLGTKDAWMIEQFARTSGVDILHHAVCQVLQRSLYIGHL